jgi:predicted nucleic acid-binding protein
VSALWDTSVLSQLGPSQALTQYVEERAIRGNPVRVAAPAVLEVSYGYEKEGSSGGPELRSPRRLGQSLADGRLRVVPLDGRAALIAGRIRGRAPHAPPSKKGDGRGKTMRQAAWLLDIQIAATAFAAGLDVATRDRRDFERIANLLTELFPAASPLQIMDGPRA